MLCYNNKALFNRTDIYFSGIGYIISSTIINRRVKNVIS